MTRPVFRSRSGPGLLAAALVLAAVATAPPAGAHPGRTNADGCHAGSRPYHCHGGGRAAPGHGEPRTPARRRQHLPVSGIATVIDGDTLEVHGRRIRLHGIDAPESGQTCTTAAGRTWRCGRRAALALAVHIGRTPVRCTPRGSDRYGRMIAVCRLGGEDLNGWMVAQGLALAYRRYSRDYVADEARARAARRGIWQGTFIAPRDWRRGKR